MGKATLLCIIFSFYCINCLVVDRDRAISIWSHFQEFSRSHEDSVWVNQCASLDLDTSLIHLSSLDTTSKGPKFRVLYLATLRSLFIMTDRWMFHTYMALANHEKYDVTLWGIGMPGFNEHESTRQNIERWFVDPTFDVVVTSWTYHSTSRGRADSDLERGKYGNRGDEFGDLPGNPIVTTIVHEVGWNGLEKIMKPNIVFVVYDQFLGVKKSVDTCGEVSTKDGCAMNPYLEGLVGLCNNPGGRCIKNQTRTMLAYMPHGIYRPLYESYANISEKEKVHNVLLVGAVHRDVYPLRHVAQQAMRSTKVMSQLRHPGYAMSWDESLLELCKYYPKVTRTQQRRYMESLAKSRICLIGTASQLVDSCLPVAWAIRKYFEAMAAGCVVIGDVPADPAIAQFVPVRLTGETAVQLAFSVEYALEKYLAGEYEDVKRRARKYVLDHYSYQSIIENYFTPAILAYLVANNPHHRLLQRMNRLSTSTATPTGATGATSVPGTRSTQSTYPNVAVGVAAAAAAAAAATKATAVATSVVATTASTSAAATAVRWKGSYDGGGVFQATRYGVTVRNDRCSSLATGSPQPLNSTYGLQRFCAVSDNCHHHTKQIRPTQRPK